MHKICTMDIRSIIQESIEVKNKLLQDAQQLQNITEITQLCIKSLKQDGKILLCGNGGSAADAQHIAAELTGRFNFDRPPLNAEALHVNTSYLTAVANDYSFDEVYSRMLEAIGRPGDVLIGISTSGNSQNIVNAMRKARAIGLVTIGLSGQHRGKMHQYCDACVNVPASKTARIQEMHILIGHILCELIEYEMFAKKDDE